MDSGSTRTRRSTRQSQHAIAATLLPLSGSPSSSSSSSASMGVETRRTSARERQELARTTRALKSRLELALYKVGRGWEQLAFERVEEAYSNGDVSSSIHDSSQSRLLDNGSLAASTSSSASSTSSSALAALLDKKRAGETAAGNNAGVSSSTTVDNTSTSTIAPDTPSVSASITAIPATRLARSASVAQHRQSPLQESINASTPMSVSRSSQPAFSAVVAPPPILSVTSTPTRPATTAPTPSSSSTSTRPLLSQLATVKEGSPLPFNPAPLSAPPTAARFSPPPPLSLAASSSSKEEAFATPASASTGSSRKRARRESATPASASSNSPSKPKLARHASYTASGSPAAAPSDVPTHKRKISQNTLWHQSRAILGQGIGGASSNTNTAALAGKEDNAQQQTLAGDASTKADKANSASDSKNTAATVFGAPRTAAAATSLNANPAGALTSPVRIRQGHPNAQQPQLLSSPYSAQVSPQASQQQQQPITTPRRQSGQQAMLQVAPHTVAAYPMQQQQQLYPHGHQYMPHQPSNLGLASSSGSSNNAGGAQQMQYSGSSQGMQHSQSQHAAAQLLQQQLSQQHPQQYIYASPQHAGMMGQDFANGIYAATQPHLLQTPQHAQQPHLLQHPHTAPQLQHPSYLTVSAGPGGYAMNASTSSGGTLYPTALAAGFTFDGSGQQQQMSPSYYGNNVNGNLVSPMNMSTSSTASTPAFPTQHQVPMAHSASMQGMPSQQQQQMPPQLSAPTPAPPGTGNSSNGGNNNTMLRRQSGLSRTPSELSSSFAGSQSQSQSQVPQLDPSLLAHSSTSNSNNGAQLSSSQDSSSLDTNFSQQSGNNSSISNGMMLQQQAQLAQQQAGGGGRRPGTGGGPTGQERETAAELMLYLAASPSPQQPSKKTSQPHLGGSGDLGSMKGRKLFGGDENISAGNTGNVGQQMQMQMQNGAAAAGKTGQQQQQQQQQTNGFSSDGKRRQSQMSNNSDMPPHSATSSSHSSSHGSANPFAAMQAAPSYAAQQSMAMPGMYDMSGVGGPLAQPFEYNQAMQFDPYQMMAQGVTLDQDFGW